MDSLDCFGAGRPQAGAGTVARDKCPGRAKAEEPSAIFHAGENRAALRETRQGSHKINKELSYVYLFITFDHFSDNPGFQFLSF